MKPLIFLFCMLIFVQSGCERDQSSVEESPVEFAANEYVELQIELEQMYNADQGLRSQIASMSSYNADLVARLNRTDSANQQRIKQILDQYGWIPRSRIGEKAADGLFYVVQHGEVEIMEKYIADLKALAAKGEARRTHAAMMEDRILMYRGQRQIYGTQATMRSAPDGSSQSFIWPVADPNRVNDLRKEAGFDLSVEENARRLNAEYDPEASIPAG